MRFKFRVNLLTLIWALGNYFYSSFVIMTLLNIILPKIVGSSIFITYPQVLISMLILAIIFLPLTLAIGKGNINSDDNVIEQIAIEVIQTIIISTLWLFGILLSTFV